MVSFGTGDLEWVKAYVLEQRDRHAAAKVVDRLECIAELEKEAEAERREAP